MNMRLFSQDTGLALAKAATARVVPLPRNTGANNSTERLATPTIPSLRGARMSRAFKGNHLTISEVSRSVASVEVRHSLTHRELMLMDSVPLDMYYATHQLPTGITGIAEELHLSALLTTSASHQSSMVLLMW